MCQHRSFFSRKIPLKSLRFDVQNNKVILKEIVHTDMKNKKMLQS